ncbi:MAG: hypothetical protein WDZ51_16425 [Pirellulaceae bacterium]
MISLFKQLRSREADRQAAAIGTYAELVEAVTDGKKLTATQVEAVLADAGKSADELEADVQARRDRLNWIHTIELGAEAKIRHDELNREKVAEINRFEEAQKSLFKEHQAKLSELSGPIGQAKIAISNATEARRQLRGNPPPVVAERIRVIDAELSELQDRIYQTDKFQGLGDGSPMTNYQAESPTKVLRDRRGELQRERANLLAEVEKQA